MPKILSIMNLVNLATFATTLVLAGIGFYPSKTLAQESPNSSNVTAQSGCLSGYFNGTYQGERSLTRNEFAAGLNACLDQINQIVPNTNNRANLATRADFEALIKRQRELNNQLQELNQRVKIPSTEKSSGF